MKSLRLILLVFLLVPFIVFSAPKQEKASVVDVLSGKEFNCEKKPSIMIGFRNGGVYGYALINTFMGRYEIKSDKDIKLSYMAYTKVSGSREQEDGEYYFFDALEKVKHYKYDNKTGILMLGDLKFIEKKK